MLDNIELNAAPPPLGKEVIAVYERDGFLRLKEFFSEQLLERYAAALGETGERENLWRSNAAVKEFVFGRRLAAIAAQLLGAERVHLLRDRVYNNAPGAKESAWEAEGNAHAVTAWVPLQETTLNMGPIDYAVASHHARRPPDVGHVREDIEPYEAGEVSFHSGWTYFRTGANRTGEVVFVLAITYFAQAPGEVVDSGSHPALN